MQPPLADDEYLLRRISPFHQPVRDETCDGGPRIRPPSAAFALRRGERALSFHSESSLRAAGEPLTYGSTPGAGQAVTRIAAGVLRKLGLDPQRDPDPEQPHHVLVSGLAALSGTEQKRMQQRIAKASEYAVYPTAS